MKNVTLDLSEELQNILYPMAEEGLNDEQKQRIEELYQKVNSGDFLNTDIDAFIENLSQNKK